MVIPSSGGWTTDDWQAWFERLLGMARAHLRDLKKGREDAVVHVHETRKILKRLRTGTRLLRGFVVRGTLRETRLSLRDAARVLSGSRDGAVRLQTFDALIEMSGKKMKGRLAEARKILLKEAAKASKTAANGAAGAVGLLDAFPLTGESWRLRGKNDVKRNLARILRRAQKYYHTVPEDGGEEFHELRKRVKDLYYSLGALPGEPSGSRKRVLMAIHVFEDSLGMLNDLAVLMEWFEACGLDPAHCPEFWKIASPAAREFRRIILEEGVILDELAARGRYRKVFLARSA